MHNIDKTTVPKENLLLMEPETESESDSTAESAAGSDHSPLPEVNTNKLTSQRHNQLLLG